MGEHARGRFADFYPFYLSQHANRTCRRLHFAGTSLGLLAALHAFSTLNSFSHPLYSLMGDWVMWKDLLTGRIRL